MQEAVMSRSELFIMRISILYAWFVRTLNSFPSEYSIIYAFQGIDVFVIHEEMRKKLSDYVKHKSYKPNGAYHWRQCLYCS